MIPARTVARVIALIAAGGAYGLAAQQRPVEPPAHLLTFFQAAHDSGGPPSPVEPSRVALLRRRIAIDLDSVPVHVALDKLSKLSGLRFIYADDVVDADHVVHLRARDITVAAALTELLVDASVNVVIRDDGDAVVVPAAYGFVPHDTASTVTGIVTDTSGAPVADAEVYVITAGRSARTDSSGRYILGHMLAGPTQLRARVPGWEPADTEIVLPPHGAATQSFVLKPQNATLAAIHITSVKDCPRQSLDGFACRRRAGVGVFRDARELAALQPIYFADLFDGVSGLRRVPLRLDEGIEPITQWRCIVYLENGHQPSWTNVMRINFLDIVAFEFYETQETVPEWYKSYAWSGHEPCSLAVLWMRGAPEVAK